VQSYSVQLIRVGEAEVRGPEAFWMARWDEWVGLTFYCILLQGGGRTILLNTGPPTDLTDLNRVWAGYQGDERAAMRVRPEDRMPEALKAYGVTPAEVDTVVLSPLSAYTTGNLELFTSATIAFSRAGWIGFMAPPRAADPTAERETTIPGSILKRLVTDWWPRVRLLEDEDEIANGVTCFRAGVHQAGTLAVRISTEVGTVIYSDAAYRRGNVERRHPIGIVRCLEEAQASYERIAREADLFLPGFETELFDEFPDGRVA
jgi:hypothetical protein